MQSMTPAHPVEFDVDYPDQPLDRVSTLLRIVPYAFALATDTYPSFRLSA